MKATRTGIAVLIVAVLIAAGVGTGVLAWSFTSTGPNPTDAYDVCEACGLDQAEVDGLVGIMRDNLANGATHEQLLDRLYATFDDHEAGKWSDCRPCAEAVLDAAKKMLRPRS